jgi:hypothetical protein
MNKWDKLGAGKKDHWRLKQVAWPQHWITITERIVRRRRPLRKVMYGIIWLIED